MIGRSYIYQKLTALRANRLKKKADSNRRQNVSANIKSYNYERCKFEGSISLHHIFKTDNALPTQKEKGCGDIHISRWHSDIGFPAVTKQVSLM